MISKLVRLQGAPARAVGVVDATAPAPRTTGGRHAVAARSL